ncbi:MAG TPA: response regulator transcription factor [Spirochaetota bacterium]|nr:response regulator transcription factor [Spirochaetota bacterium]
MKKSQVFIVDDHPIFRRGLKQLINEEPDLEVCAEAENVFNATTRLRNIKPDIAVVDITLNDTSGLEIIKFMHDNRMNIPSLVLSMHDEKIFAERAIKSGAMGYIMKQEMAKQVAKAIRHVLSGKIYLSEEMNERILNSITVKKGNSADALTDDPLMVLTGRELEIYMLLGKGYKRKDIAGMLNLNVNTIGTYREKIKEKMGFESSSALLAHAITWVKKQESGNPTAQL